MNYGWEVRARELESVRRAVLAADPHQRWDDTRKGDSADANQVRRLASDLGRPLDGAYLEFLSCVDGWKSVLEGLSLFSLENYRGPEYQEALELLISLDEITVQDAGLDLSRSVPIGANPVGIDLIVLTNPAGIDPSPISWIAGYQVHRWASFDEFFSGMISGNREWLEWFESGMD